VLYLGRKKRKKEEGALLRFPSTPEGEMATILGGKKGRHIVPFH